MNRSASVRSFFEQASPGFARTVHPYAARRRGEALSERVRGEILEIGCGSGAVTARLMPHGNVVAGDIAFGMARQTKSTLGVHAVVLDGGRLPFREKSFDSVVCAEAIYYLDRPLDLIEEAYRVLRPGGTLALSCMGGLWQSLDRLRILATRLGLRWGSEVPPAPHEVHVRDIRTGLRQAGFGLKAERGVLLAPSVTLHRLNVWLEGTALARMAAFWIFHSEKPL